ncbi:hypothetical protein [Gottfriedia acidiceleris]|uniref:hypothetical protein n=1 Tax=Gottfriedia acidiceleris TaxID=371036 RepID=UPI00101C5924|nr:hypothetical protein [Gottfriedia acidiceleris]
MQRIVTIPTTDKERHMRFGTNQVVEVEEQLGMGLIDAAENPTFKVMRTIFYAGLKWEDKELTLEAVGDFMDDVIFEHGFAYLADKMGQAIEGTFGDKPSAVEGEKKA